MSHLPCTKVFLAVCVSGIGWLLGLMYYSWTYTQVTTSCSSRTRSLGSPLPVRPDALHLQPLPGLLSSPSISLPIPSSCHIWTGATPWPHTDGSEIVPAGALWVITLTRLEGTHRGSVYFLFLHQVLSRALQELTPSVKGNYSVQTYTVITIIDKKTVSQLQFHHTYSGIKLAVFSSSFFAHFFKNLCINCMLSHENVRTINSLVEQFNSPETDLAQPSAFVLYRGCVLMNWYSEAPSVDFVYSVSRTGIVDACWSRRDSADAWERRTYKSFQKAKRAKSLLFKFLVHKKIEGKKAK